MTEKKEVVVIYVLTKLELGGAQKVCLTLFNDIPTDDNNTTTYLISGQHGVLVDAVQGNPRAFLLPSFTREVHWKTAFTEIKNFLTLRRTLVTLKNKHRDAKLIVHTHSTKAGLLGRWAAFLAGIPNRVHTVHGYGFHEDQNPVVWCLIYILELITSFITTHFICVSHADVATGTEKFYNFPSRTSVIRAGVDEKQFYRPAERSTFPRPTFIFGTIACFKPQKNIADLLRAFHLVATNNPYTRLEIIGDGDLRPEIERLIKYYNLQNVVTLHGWHRTPHTVMKNWHTFVLSSLWEGLPCSVIEARLLGLPVISYNTGGINEVITHGLNGLLFNKRNWRELGYSMLEMSKNSLLYQRLTAYPDELQEFSNSVMVSEHHALYEKLVK